jgi:glycosyltransferase involved in cell wall biosynthesis
LRSATRGVIPVSVTPDVSIVVAAHNEERLLPRCLDAIARQRAALSTEVIVVDNGSTDRTAEIARAHPGVRLLSEERLGAVHAKAAGVRAARGAIVAVIDADSVCAPDWIERVHARFAAEPALVGLTGPAHYIDARPWAPAVMWLWYSWWRLVSFFFGRAVYAVGTNVSFRREDYLKSRGYDTGVLVGGDEISLFSSLAKVGRTRFDPSLSVDTDGRRTEMGLVRFLLEIAILQYLINYPYYRLTGRSLLRGYRPGSTLR